MDLRERFESKVERIPGVDCHIWIAALKTTGYGAFLIDGKNKAASRVAYELYVGPIPHGLHVRHTCDVRECVNPAHLVLGTHADNMRDMSERGRCRPVRLSGEKHGRSKLTELQVKEIRRRYVSRDPVNGSGALAKEFGISMGHVYQLLTKSRWRES